MYVCVHDSSILNWVAKHRPTSCTININNSFWLFVVVYSSLSSDCGDLWCSRTGHERPTVLTRCAAVSLTRQT